MKINDKGYLGAIIGMSIAFIMLASAMLAITNKYQGSVRIQNAQNDLHTIGNLTGLASNYYAATGQIPTFSGLNSSGYFNCVMPACNAGNGTYTTQTGAVISFYPTGGGAFGTSVTLPTAMTATGHNLTPLYQNALQGSSLSGSTLSWNQPVPSLASLSSKFVQLNPNGAGQTINGPLATNGSFSTNGNPLSAGQINSGNISSQSINTNGQPINSGALTASQVYVPTANHGYQPVGAIAWESSTNTSGTWNGLQVSGAYICISWFKSIKGGNEFYVSGLNIPC